MEVLPHLHIVELKSATTQTNKKRINDTYFSHTRNDL